MDYDDLLSKEMRVNFWETQGRIPSFWEIEWQKMLSDKESLVV
jgi:hypothetical protein